MIAPSVGDRVWINLRPRTRGIVVAMSRFNATVRLLGQWAERAGFERETVVQVSPGLVSKIEDA